MKYLKFFEDINNDRKIKFVGKRNLNLAFNVYVDKQNRITEIENKRPHEIKFPFEIGQYYKTSSVENWACNNNFFIDGKDTCPEKRIFGIRTKDIPEGHEFRHIYPNKFR